MENNEQIKIEIPSENTKTQAKIFEKVKKLELKVATLERKVEVLYKSLRR